MTIRGLLLSVEFNVSTEINRVYEISVLVVASDIVGGDSEIADHGLILLAEVSEVSLRALNDLPVNGYDFIFVARAAGVLQALQDCAECRLNNDAEDHEQKEDEKRHGI